MPTLCISRIFTLWLCALAVPFSPAARADDLKFDEVILLEGKGRDVSVLYVVLTEPKADLDKLRDLVVKYARTALKEAAGRKFKGTTGEGKPKYEGYVVFFVRSAKGDRQGACTGFGVGHLKEIATAKPDEGRKRVRAAWAFGELPPK
jgi:hypothetical protein